MAKEDCGKIEGILAFVLACVSLLVVILLKLFVRLPAWLRVPALVLSVFSFASTIATFVAAKNCAEYWGAAPFYDGFYRLFILPFAFAYVALYPALTSVIAVAVAYVSDLSKQREAVMVLPVHDAVSSGQRTMAERAAETRIVQRTIAKSPDTAAATDAQSEANSKEATPPQVLEETVNGSAPTASVAPETTAGNSEQAAPGAEPTAPSVSEIQPQ